MRIFLILLALFTSAQGIQKIFEPATGAFCGKVTCTHPGGTLYGNVPLNQVFEIGFQYYSEDKGRGVELYYALNQGGTWSVAANGAEAAELSFLDNFQFDPAGDKLVVSTMIKNPSYCQNHERYSCYMGYDDGTGMIYVDTIGDDTLSPIDDIPVGGGGGTDDEEPTVQMAVINIMSTMADEVEKLHLLLDTRADILSNATDSVRDNIQTDGDVFVDDLKTGLHELTSNLETFKGEIGEEVASAYNAISMDVGLRSQELEAELQTLVSELEKQLDNQQQNLENGANGLKDAVAQKISEISQVGESNILGLQKSLKTDLSSLELDIQSSGKSTAELFTAANNDLHQEVSNTENEAKIAMENVGVLAGKDLTSLEKSFSSKVKDLNDNLNQSIETTKANLEQNSASFTNAIAKQLAQLQDSTQGASENLKTTVGATSNDIQTELDNKKKTTTARLQEANNVISVQSTKLITQISDQDAALLTEVNASAAKASKSFSEAKDSILSASKSLKTNVTSQVGTVNDKLGTEQSNMKSKISEFTSSSDSALNGLSAEVATTLNNLKDKSAEGITDVQGKFTSEMDLLEQNQVASSESKMKKITEDLTNLGIKLVQEADDLNSNVDNKIKDLNTNTLNIVSTMNTNVEANINAINNQVGTIDQDITNAINALSQNSQTSLESAFASLESNVENLQTVTLRALAAVAQNTRDTLNDVGDTLNISVDGLETESLTKLSGIQTDTANALANLKSQSEGISQHVKNLGSEITTQQGKLTELLTKFGELTKQLGDVTAQISQFQTGLDTYKDKASKMFTDTNSDLTTKGQSTIGLMSGVVNKIGQLTTVMETALTSFHKNVQQLGSNIETVGTNVGVFVNSNIDEIMGNMDNNTARITSFLQPKKCVRNMNYASVSNTQYVVITPNAESSVDFNILCDTATDGGGWIVIQRRKQNDIVFFRNWQFYKEGFGNMETDFYMGNDRIHQLTSQGDYELRITLEKDEQEYIANYDTFSIDGEDNFYTLHIDGYTGTAGDAMAYHNGMPFSTSDKDNDLVRRLNCATHQQGAWWYKECRHSNLNGDWETSMDWSQMPIRGVVSSTEMKIRLKQQGQ